MLANLITIFCGLFAGFITLMVLNLVEGSKYSVVAPVSILIIPAFLAVKNREKLLLAAFLFALTVNPTFTLIDGPRDLPVTLRYSLRLHLSDLFLFALLAIYIIKSTIRENSGISIRNSKIALPLILWASMCSISFFQAKDLTAAGIGVLEMVRMLLTFYVFFKYTRDFGDLTFFIWCLFTTLLLQSILMFAQFQTGSLLLEWAGRGAHVIETAGTATGQVFRPVGTMDHSSHFAKLCGFVLPVALSLGFFGGKAQKKLFPLCVWVFGSIALVLTISRAGLATWIVSQWLLFIGAIVFQMASVRRFFLIGLFWLFLWSSILFAIGGVNLLNRAEDDEGSAAARLPMFKVALSVIQAHPLFGVGIGNYKFVYRKYDRTPERISQAFPFQPVHNLFLLFAAETGIPGLAFFLWFCSVFISCTHYLFMS